MRQADTLLTDLLVLDRAAGGPPLHRQLYQQIRGFILDGTLPPGSLLPPSRKLASETRLSRNTVTNAYGQLMAEGLTETRTGSGTHTLDISRCDSSSRPQKKQSTQAASGAKRVTRLRSASHSSGNLGGDALLPGFPDPREFPTKLWNRLVNRASRQLATLLTELDMRAGYAPLRQALAQYLNLSRGVMVAPEQIFITAGASQSLQLITRALTNTGDTVWLENPAYGVAALSLQMADLAIQTLPTDKHGAVVPKRFRKPPELIYLTTSYQYPLGVTMPMSRRLQWLDSAQQHEAWLVEDDYDGEFRYHRDPIPALAGLLDNQRTLYMGTFSKILSPTLRTSFLVVPPAAVESVRQIYPMLGNESSIITQAALAELIVSGHFSSHIKRMRALYGERREAMELALAKHLGLEQKMTPGGLHITIGVEGQDEVLVPGLVAQGLGCLPLSDHYLSPEAEQGFLLGFTSREPETITSSIQRFAEVMCQHSISPKALWHSGNL